MLAMKNRRLLLSCLLWWLPPHAWLNAYLTVSDSSALNAMHCCPVLRMWASWTLLTYLFSISVVVTVLFLLKSIISICCCCCWVASVVSDSVRPHRRQPTRLPCPWDFPGKNAGVGCHFLLPVHESEKWKWSRSVVSDSLWPHGLSPPGSPVPGILQAGVL